jgi:hypothetical protein
MTYLPLTPLIEETRKEQVVATGLSSVHLTGFEPVTFGSVVLLSGFSQVKFQQAFVATSSFTARFNGQFPFRQFRGLSRGGWVEEGTFL